MSQCLMHTPNLDLSAHTQTCQHCHDKSHHLVAHSSLAHEMLMQRMRLKNGKKDKRSNRLELGERPQLEPNYGQNKQER